MYLSLKWLQTFIPDFEYSGIDELKHKIDTRLSEVESVAVKGTQLNKLVVGKIVKVNEHPTNKNLTVCSVDTAEEKPRTIICGAPNAKEGLNSVVCLPGGQVIGADGKAFKISERKMGEVISEGMICAPDELGMSDDHSKIIELPESAEVGKDVTELFQDVIIEIENKAVPHRPDVFSHLGIARELAAIFNLEIVEKKVTAELSPEADVETLPLEVKISNPELCKRFSATVLDEVKIEPSPLWMQIMLSYTGIRPINNIVDVTNYIMFDIGQPMHAFDYNKLPKPELNARLAKAGEKLLTLDGKQRELSSEMMIVASGDEAESVAGIMGGENTEVDSQTTAIVLEAANWERYQIRRTSRELGLRSEASTRFEKGISTVSTVPAISQAVSLISDIAGGRMRTEIIDEYPTPEPQIKIEFDLNNVKRLLGVEIEKSKIVTILKSLQIQVEGEEHINPEALYRPGVTAIVTLHIPPHRQDLNITQDIVEEIGRLYGYENITPTLPSRDLTPPATSKHQLVSKTVKNILAHMGYTEIYTYSMVGPELYETALLNTDSLINIPNPISPELGFIRDKITPSLLGKVKQNIQKFNQFGLFELSRVALDKKEDGIPTQPFKLAMIMVGDDEVATYRKLKSAIDYLSGQLTYGQLEVSNISEGNSPFLHPGKSGSINLAEKKIGEIGIIHPLVLDNLDLSNYSISIAEINFSSLVEAEVEIPQFQEISTLQPVKRDLNLWQGSESEIGQFIDHLLSNSSQFSQVTNVELIDTYQDDSQELPKLTFRFTLQPSDKTFSQEEIDSILEEIIESAADFDLGRVEQN